MPKAGSRRALRVAILAGGRGSRLGDADGKPKPLAEIGGHPLIRHVMDRFRAFGLDDFVVALGHRGAEVREYFERHPLPAGTLELIDTGAETMTGGRIRRLRPHLGEATFLLAWSDGLTDLDIAALVAFHAGHGRAATVVAVTPPPRFGRLTLDGDRVTAFAEKPMGAEGWINGGVFVLEPAVFDRIAGDETAWERVPLEGLARDGELMAYRHAGFWDCVDTPSDLARLRRMWTAGNAPWASVEGVACASS